MRRCRTWNCCRYSESPFRRQSTRHLNRLERMLKAFGGRPCKRLTMRVLDQSARDGWITDSKQDDEIDEIIALCIARGGDGILAALLEAQRYNGKLLDGIGGHIAERIA